MMDWLNIKAALSITVFVIILTASAYYNIEKDKLDEELLRSNLEYFTEMINSVLVSPSLMSLNITFTAYHGTYIRTAVYEMPDGKPYEITLTSQKAIFSHGDNKCSRNFIGTIQTVSTLESYCMENVSHERAVNMDELEPEPFLRFNSDNMLRLVKLDLEHNGITERRVLAAFH